MTLVTSFQSLQLQQQRLHEAFAALHVAVTVDKPPDQDAALVQGLGDTIDGLLGQLEDAGNAAREALEAASYPTDLHRARHALARCQGRCTQVLHEAWAELYSYDRIAELTMLGEEHGGEWTAWVASVRVELERCAPPAYELSRALAQCWEELAERAAISGVSVQSTNIGQQITVPDASAALRTVP